MAIVAPSIAMAGPSRLAEVSPLAFELDTSCPSTLSHKPIVDQLWPFEISGPSTVDQNASSFIKRRYLETLLLPDVSSQNPDLSRDKLTE